jgi:DNA-binding transcriptional LysR family regulator
MTIRHLRLFIAVAETGTMRRAAEQFYISQPSVSQAIAELEEHYGVRLFERLNRKLYITPYGQQLLEMAKGVVREFDRLEKTMLQSAKTPILQFGATVTVGTSLAGKIAAEFKARCPAVSLRVWVDNTAAIEQKLLSGELDAALVEGEVKSPDLTVTPAADDYLCLVCGNGHPFADRTGVGVRELAGESFILREEGSGTRERFVRFMEAAGVPLQIGWVSTNSEAIKNAVIQNLGLSVISLRLVEQEVRDGKLHIVRMENDNGFFKRNFSLVLHKNKFITPALTALLQTITALQDDDIRYLLPR